MPPATSLMRLLDTIFHRKQSSDQFFQQLNGYCLEVLPGKYLTLKKDNENGPVLFQILCGQVYDTKTPKKLIDGWIEINAKSCFGLASKKIKDHFDMAVWLTSFHYGICVKPSKLHDFYRQVTKELATAWKVVDILPIYDLLIDHLELLKPVLKMAIQDKKKSIVVFDGTYQPSVEAVEEDAVVEQEESSGEDDDDDDDSPSVQSDSSDEDGPVVQGTA